MKLIKCRLLLLTGLFSLSLVCLGCRSGFETSHGSVSPSNLSLSGTIDRWDEALPLGNGLTGGLLWGNGDTLRLSLDRGDLWDLRTPEMLQREDWTYETMKRLKAEGNQELMVDMFDRPYNEIPYPTKIPAGRLELTFPVHEAPIEFSLQIGRAEATVSFENGSVRSFFSAEEPVAMLRIEGRTADLHLIAPAALIRLQYPMARAGSDTTHEWFVQEDTEGLEYAVVVGRRDLDGTSEIAIAITSSTDEGDPLMLGLDRVDRALESGYDAMLDDHLSWWSEFWSASSITIPEPALQKHYDFVKYLYGAGSRKGTPPIPLQGVWTADEGNLPPWKGDFHNDLNTQMTYLAYHTAGLLESGESFLDWNWKLLEKYRDFADTFYGVEGAIVPGVMTLYGDPMGGWGQYSLSPTNGIWVAQSFYLHWRYTMDADFLRTRAYPFCAEIADAVANLLVADENGRMKLPLSTSPEIHNNSMQAWLTPNSNYDLSLMIWLFSALTEMADARDDAVDARKWSDLLSRLDQLDTDSDGGLTFAKDEPYNESHRHFSHTMAIHPLGILDVNNPEHLDAINASVERIHEMGTQSWVGYSFSWMSAMLARTGRSELALAYLRDYERAFISRNGFHLNGDQSGERLSGFSYRPFTLEGNFLAMQAVHEMLLQSHNRLVSIFPSVSDEWADVSFRDLRAEGGFKISATRIGGQTRIVSITAVEAGPLRFLNPFLGSAAEWDKDFNQSGDVFVVELVAGETLTGKLR